MRFVIEHPPAPTTPARVGQRQGTNERYALRLATIVALSLTSQFAFAQQQVCGDGMEGLQVDYNDPQDAALLNNINFNHFNENVRTVRGGQTGPLPADLDYALRNSPNHHQALYVMSEYHLRLRAEKVAGETYSMNCWFERAMRFAPKDAVVPMIYGIYLHRKGDHADAEREYKRSIEMTPEFAEAHYNLGLLYFDRKQYQNALTQAREAYRLGYPLPGLRQKLVAAGAWRDESSKPIGTP